MKCIQRRPNVFDVGTTLYKYYANVLCLLGRWSVGVITLIVTETVSNESYDALVRQEACLL